MPAHNATDCFIGIGSNMGLPGGTPEGCVREALKRLAALEGLEVVAVSSLYRSEPVGFVCDDWFVNGVARVRTTLPPSRLLAKLKNIEAAMGRRGKIKKRYESRIIDLDLLLYGNLITDEDFLSVPHPRMSERSFVLAPMVEIAPEVLHPLFRVTMRDLLDEREEEHAVIKLES